MAAMDVDMDPAPGEPSLVSQATLDKARALEATNVKESIALLRSMVFGPVPETDEELKAQERAVYRLGVLYSEQRDADSVMKLTKDIRPVLQNFPKARTAKIVRQLIDTVHKAQGERPQQTLVDICLDCIAWAREEKRTFLRHRVETRL